MPLYEWQCVACDVVTERFAKVDECQRPIACPACAGSATRILSRPVIRGEITPYYDEGLGRVILTRQQRTRAMKEQGLVEVGTHTMSGAKGTIFSHPGRATERVEKSGAHLGPITSAAEFQHGR